jgi:LPS sulfotransferase NodH
MPFVTTSDRDAAAGFDGTAPVRFVILTEARSGSNLLVSLLDSHPNISCHSEVFHRKAVFAKPPLRNVTVAWRDAHIDETLQTVFSAPSRETDIAAAGFKLFYYHKPRLLLRLAADSDVRVIVLRRKDKLAQYASRKISLRTGYWRAQVPARDAQRVVVYRPADEPEPARVEYRVLEHLGHTLFSGFCHFAALRVLALYRSPVLLVTYEDLAADRDRELGRVQEFLGVQSTATLTTMQRQNPISTLARFSNPDAAWRWGFLVQRALDTTQYRKGLKVRDEEPR